MHWLSAASAWFALSCLLIIAMYMLKKRYEPKSISSHLLWRKALLDHEANKPLQRLRQRLLLYLQLLIAIIIVLALMEPVVVKQLARDTHVIVLLDRSASMATGAEDDGQSYLDKAKLELQQWIDDQFAGGSLTLIINGDYPSIVLNRSQKKAEIEQAIMQIEPYYGASDDETALSLAKALANQDEHTIIHYFIDHHFKAGAHSLQPQPVQQQFWHMYGNEKHIAADDKIRSFSLTTRGHGVSAFVTVLHGQHQEDEQLELTIAVFDEKGKQLHEETINKQPQSEGVTTLQAEGLPLGYYYSAELKPRSNDYNRYNNKQFGILSQQSTYQALLISDGNLFLEKALQLMNVEVTKLAKHANAPNSDMLDGVQFIIVDGGYDHLRKDTAWQSLLDSYPLWIFDHPSANESAELLQKQPVVHQHEVTTYFSMEDTYISSVKQLDMSELSGYEVLLEYGGAPAIIAGDYQQKPFLRFAFALQDSDLPLRAPFPILMMQSIEYMTSGSKNQLGSMLVGTQPTLSLSANTSSSYWNKVAIDKEISEADMPKTIEIANSAAVVAPQIPGVYELIEKNQHGEVVQQRIAIIHADSSEFAFVNSSSVNYGAAHDQATNGHAPAAKEDTEANGLSSLVPWLAALLLFLMLCEWEVYRRGL